MQTLIGTVLVIAMFASLVYWLIDWVDAWNTRPVSLFDAKYDRWRAHSLQGKPWNTKRHGERPARLSQLDPLEQSLPKLRSWNDPLWPALVQSLEQPEHPSAA